MADATLHRRSLYPTDRSSNRSNVPDPSFAIIPDWSTRLKVTSRGGDTKDCLLLNIKPRVAVTLQFRQPASMKFDMVGGVLSGPGCEAVESAFECLRQEWLSSNPEGPAQAWKAVIESSENARTIPTVVEQIVALEPQWKSFLTRFSDTSNADMTRDDLPDISLSF